MCTVVFTIKRYELEKFSNDYFRDFSVNMIEDQIFKLLTFSP
jgi:hypothetical protein